MQFIKWSLCICVLLLVEWARCSPSAGELKLETVQVLFRHGDRTPERTELRLLPKAIQSRAESWGNAQLTNEGKQREYKLGQMLRRRYRDFLGSAYRPQDVFAYSPDVDRTKNSLQLVLAALYPPTGKHVWNEELRWTPIPIHTTPAELDVLLYSSACPKYARAFEELMETAEIKKRLQRYEAVFQFVRSIYPNRTIDLDQLFLLNNLLNIQKTLNVPLPDWYTPQIHSELSSASKLLLDMQSYTPELRRLNTGPLVKRFISNMNAEGGEPRAPSRKLYLYCGHEYTVYGLAKSHNVTLDKSPDYGSALILEKLRPRDGQSCVKLFYWTGVSEELHELPLSDCGECCPIPNYLSLVNASLPTDSEMRCLYENLKPSDLERYLFDDSHAII